MKSYFTTVSIVALTVVLSVVTNAQIPSSPRASVVVATATSPADDDAPYTLKGGDNEFGGWAGISFKATTIFAGLSEAEAADRKFFLAAFRYGRTLYANDSIALQYTLDAIPVAVATGVITGRTSVGGVTVFQRDTAYGGGVSPLGFQIDFANGSRVHPFAHVTAGILGFTKAVPIEDSGKLAFTLEGGGGVRIFTSARRAITLGLRVHHISNGDRTGSNRGLNQFVFYAGYSVFK
ncbi:MAG TPA: acyloxyacyl hydrolase [Pyrinomonadaceae bacterium]|nr:acyloxyacyl hydrolase [Pyrinomonadaceae bacterium]